MKFGLNLVLAEAHFIVFRGVKEVKLLCKKGGFSLQGNGQGTVLATGDLETGTEMLLLFVQPRSREGRGGYRTTLAKHFSTAPGLELSHQHHYF